MSKINVIVQMFQFLKENKKWWLMPIILIFILLGGLIVLAKGSALAPFIYALF